ncbi:MULTISPECIES: membrane-spanning protein [Neobacillus]|uniref:Membrane-spanning protein n=1 Tax=Neobacillus citreus TaxID=2833578 RepID=A0A942T382_9BACI|nr:membrane-spanning protein [Neobacillus citreus]MCH6269328.1 membrane-spanning protein [Neobacillus citreus]
MWRKVLAVLSTIFILFMAVLFIIYIMKGDSTRWQVALGGILVSALPLFLLRFKKNPFNLPIIIGYYFFLFCTLYLGSISSFYLHYKWWDSTLHFYKGVYVGIVGIALFKNMITTKARNDVSSWILFLFVLSLSVLASALWEIYEFLGDITFTHTMQRGGNKDTMLDLLFGLAGGILVAVYAKVRKQTV